MLSQSKKPFEMPLRLRHLTAALIIMSALVFLSFEDVYRGEELGGLPGAQLSAARLAVNQNAIVITNQDELAAIDGAPPNDQPFTLPELYT